MDSITSYTVFIEERKLLLTSCRMVQLEGMEEGGKKLVPNTSRLKFGSLSLTPVFYQSEMVATPEKASRRGNQLLPRKP